MGNTILGKEPTEDEIKQWEAEKLDWQRFEILINIYLEHYIAIGTKPDLANFCRGLVSISDDFEGEILKPIPLKGKHHLIGEVIIKAVLHDRTRDIKDKKGKSPVSNKAAFKSLVKDLVDLASKHKSKTKYNADKKEKNIAKADTAFQIVADLLYKYGISDNDEQYSSSTIANWCYDYSSKVSLQEL